VNECRTCELVARRNQGAAPPWDAVLRTAHWDVVHAFGTDVEGWMVLVTRRHIASVAEMTDDEAAEFGPLLLRVSTALGEAVGCERTYVAQFAEAEGHHHVHVHVVPRMPDQPDEAKGPRVFSRLGLPDDRCVPEARMNELATRLRGLLRD
jgi:diadenosine tetraphosphate (Ap4A) HIT family hydrolase